MTGRPKVPRRPTTELGFRRQDYFTYREPLWRIARTSGDHVLPWNHLRAFGPVIGQRWDPHRPPPSTQPERAVLYAATSLLTAAAEVWQHGRHIDPAAGHPIVVRFTPSRSLRLLDLSAPATWSIRNGASAALAEAPRPVCRKWAAAILDQAPDLDGLYAPSTMTGTNVVLFPGSRDAIPDDFDLSVAAADPGVVIVLRAIAADLGYTIDSAPPA